VNQPSTSISLSNPSILIIGIGNDILTDDGIGPRLANDLNKNRLPPGIAIIQATLGGMELLELIRDYDVVIIIDALKSGMHQPGTVLCFVPKDFEETLNLSNIHDIDFLTALELGKRTGMKIPSTITIIAIEIVEDRVFSKNFSPEIASKYPYILHQVQKKVEETLAISITSWQKPSLKKNRIRFT